MDISNKNIIFVIDNKKKIIIIFIVIRPILTLRLYKINEIVIFLSKNLHMSKKSSTFASKLKNKFINNLKQQKK